MVKLRDFLRRDRWIKGHMAVRRDGRMWKECRPGDTTAERFCLSGAINRCYATQTERNAVRKIVFKYIKQVAPRAESIEDFNDSSHTNFDRVRKVLLLANK